MKVLVVQLCLTLGDHMDCSLRGSSVHGIFQATVLEWGAISFSKKAFKLYQMQGGYHALLTWLIMQ